MNKDMSLEERVAVIERRNERVEADKAWETSAVRRLVIAVLTYVVIGVFLVAIGVARPWVNALVPVIGFLLSTVTVSWVKEVWVRRRQQS